MLQRRSPPKHRHDGTSPLPLGMDWSPPPRKWNGHGTVWPHDPHTGWSYCVMIPSWVLLPKSRNSDPVVFYRVQVGVQSPDGSTTTHGILRRFNDFLKLFTDIKNLFPKKNIPPAPPKGLLWKKSGLLLEERRCSLEEWMTKLLSDIDLSRSVAIATFLELEAAARSSFKDVNQYASEANSPGNSASSSPQLHPHSSLSFAAGSSSIASDYGSDTAYETSDLGTPRHLDDNSEICIEDLSLDEDFSSPIEKLVKYGMSNIDEGLFMGQTILEQLESFPRHKVHNRNVNNVMRKDFDNGNASTSSFLASNGTELFSEAEHGKVVVHIRKLSAESVGSDASLKGSEMSNSGIPNSSGEGSLHLPDVAEVSRTMDSLGNTESRLSGDTQIVLPQDQRHKMNRVLMTMQQRLVTAKTDMEDLIARLNQEMAIKGYLYTKVKDLEVEVETTKQKSKENLQQAILIERERITQMQWDMEELRQKSLEMEYELKSEKGENSHTESTKVFTLQDKEVLLQELAATKVQLENSLKQYKELEIKSKADIKVLVKEVKSLRNFQTEMKEELSQSLKEKSEAERILEQEKQMSEYEKAAREKLLNDCRILHTRLQDCNILFPTDDEDNIILDSTSLSKALDLLTISDAQLGLLLAEVKLFTQHNDSAASGGGNRMVDDELRKMLSDLLTDNARLRKQMSYVIRSALKTNAVCNKDDDEAASRDPVVQTFSAR